MEVLPAILAHDAEDFRSRIHFPGLASCAQTVHVDIPDGTLFNATCFADPTYIASWGNIPAIELHVMTANPMRHIAAWHRYVPQVRRAIVHLEIASALPTTLREIRSLHLETGVAISPRFHVDDIAMHQHNIDRLLIMGIEPGRSGQTFLGDPILAKIQRARHLFPNIHLAVDGGVSLENAHVLAENGAQSLVASSAIWNNPHPIHACEQLVHRSMLSTK